MDREKAIEHIHREETDLQKNVTLTYRHTIEEDKELMNRR